ncbi:MAG: hypothetical protein ACM3X5_02290 [Bacillota bacterium]
MARPRVAAFFVGVTNVATTRSALPVFVAAVGVSELATVSKLDTAASGRITITMGGMMHPTSLQDPSVAVQIFDTGMVDDEANSDRLIKRAQDLFADPDRALAAREISRPYCDALKEFKRQITHCAVSTMRIVHD